MASEAISAQVNLWVAEWYPAQLPERLPETEKARPSVR
jgi:hypothetical protein